jgi:hypothetical protein
MDIITAYINQAIVLFEQLKNQAELIRVVFRIIGGLLGTVLVIGIINLVYAIFASYRRAKSANRDSYERNAIIKQAFEETFDSVGGALIIFAGFVFFIFILGLVGVDVPRILRLFIS